MDYDIDPQAADTMAQQKKSLYEQAERMSREDVMTQGRVGRNETLEPCKMSMKERFEANLYQAKRQSRKRDQLEELLHLLDKHPEVARILDLIESLQ